MADWDDDDYDPTAHAKKPAPKSSWEDEDEDEEPSKGAAAASWEEFDEEEAKPKPKAAPKPAAAKPKPKPKPKAKEEPEPVLSPQEERLRRRQMEEARDAALASDLFAGFKKQPTAEELAAKAAEEERARKEALKPKVEVIDAFEQLVLASQSDVSNLASTCVTKLNKGAERKAGGGIILRFLQDLVKELEKKTETKDLVELEKVIAQGLKDVKAVKGMTADAKTSKANMKVTKTSKFDAGSAWEEVYGGGEGDEDWTPEEWEEWERQQAAAGAKPGKW